MHKQLFDDAIGEVPPSTVDVDAAITRGRRAARLRRVANPAVAAGAAVVLLTGAVAYTMTRDDGAGWTTAASPPPTTSNAEEPPPTPPGSCRRKNLESADKLNDRLTQVLTLAFHTQRPDVTLTTNESTAVGRGPLEFYQVSGSQLDSDAAICHFDTYSMARATTHGPEGAGNILIAVQPSYRDWSALRCDDGSAEETFCDVVTFGSGDVVRRSTATFEGGTSRTRVDVIRADLTSVVIIADNIDTSIKTGGAPTASRPPLTVDQLVAIGTAPGMTLFP